MTDSEYHLPLLYKLDKNSVVRYWECKIISGTFHTRAGILPNRETHKWKIHDRVAYSSYDISHGSYKAPDQIAYEHAISKWTEKKRNDVMTENIDDLVGDDKKSYPIPVAPVLATRYDVLQERDTKYKKCVESGRKPSTAMYCFPDREYYWEYKFDGERGIICYDKSISDVRIYSRSRIELPYLESQKDVFKRIFEAFSKKVPDMLNYQFDCEIMHPDKSRNKMRSAISRIKEKHPDNDKIIFYLFDIVTVYGMPYKMRREILEKIMTYVKNPYIQLVPTVCKAKLGDPIIDEECARAFELGFEGLVGKDEEFIYPLSNLRINEIVKYKIEHSDEYRIVSAYEGIDSHKGLIVLTVEDTNNGLIRFNVTPSWSHDERKDAWIMYQEDPKQFIGLLITIVYKYKNEYGKPEEARATRIRELEDISIPLNN